VLFQDATLTGDLNARFVRVGTGFFLQSDAPRGNTIEGSIELGGADIPKLLRIRNTRVGKSIEAGGVATAELQILGPTTAKHLTMTGLKCLGAADITGLDLSGHWPTAESQDGAVIADLATFGKKLIVAKSLTEGATIPGRLELSGSTIGELAVSVSSFKEEVTVENLKLHGILLSQAQINKFSAIASESDYPRPIDLSFSEIKWWEFREGNESESDKAEDYLQLLEGDPHKQRHTFSSIEQNLFNRGLDDAADEVHVAMRKWLRGEFGRWLKNRGRSVWDFWLKNRRRSVWDFWPKNRGRSVRDLLTLFGRFDRWLSRSVRDLWTRFGHWLGRSLWDFLTLSTTSPLLLLIIVLISTIFSAVGVFSNPANIGPSETGLIAHPEWRADQRPLEAEWNWWSGAWMAVRFHVPVAVLTARSAWAPANGKELTVSLPYLSWRTARLSPEDYANIVLALHCLIWPVILIIGSRKFFMRLGK